MTRGIGKWALCALLMSGTVVAQDHESVIEIALSSGNDQEDIVVRIDSREQGFNLEDLQVGESRALTTTDGRPVTVTRALNSYEFDVEGQEISMPLMNDGEPPGTGGPYRKEVRVERFVGDPAGTSAATVTIVSSTALDDSTRASITAALAAAGLHDVEFIETSEMGHGAHLMHDPADGAATDDVRIIRKKVRITN